MLGSIIGDIVGSTYEFNNIETKDFTFFHEHSEVTDDSILTIATADWLLHGGNVAHYYSNYAARYDNPMGGYGNSFKVWVMRSQETGDFRPYNSCGNGSAMRVGPVGWAFDYKEDVLHYARMSAECTHNHPEGIKGAQATALCIFLARHGASKDEIKRTVEHYFGYDLSLTIDEIRPRYSWDGLDRCGNGGTCQGSVPQAIRAFLDGKDFEDCVRNAISIGGDSDTIGCITGSIAEAFYGIPDDMRARALAYLPSELKEIVEEFEAKYGKGAVKCEPRIYNGTERPRFTPDAISVLKDDEVFVFGSNLAGIHGGGAARVAATYFGAIMGQGTGLQGQSYAIPTMQGGVDTIRPYVDEFIEFAKNHTELFFYVTRIGCGIAGFTDAEIAPLFAQAVGMENICLPESFINVLNHDAV